MDLLKGDARKVQAVLAKMEAGSSQYLGGKIDKEQAGYNRNSVENWRG